MRKYIWLAALLAISFSLQAQLDHAPASEGNASVEILSEDASGIIVSFSLDGILSTTVSTSLGDAIIPHFEGSAAFLMAGAPELASIAKSVIVGAGQNLQLQIISADYTDYPNVLVAPSKGNLTRNIDPNTVNRVFGSIYQKDAFFPAAPARLGDDYILRDFHGQPIVFQPVQYNPVTKVLRVYSEIKVKLAPQNGAFATGSSSNVDQTFDKIYEHHFLNYSPSKYTPLADEGNMLIICHGPFMASMQPLVEWKNLRGMPTEIVNVSTIGTNASAIKTYITNYYNTNGLTFVLLVGDAAQVPTNSVSAGHSDNYYGYLSGNDSYPEVLIGRFSAENLAHVETMVERTLNYEKTPNTSSDWLNRNIGIASSQGPGDDNEMDYQHVRNMQNDLTAYTYTTSAELFDGSQGGLDANGNPTSSMVTTEINAGAGIILYTGHGSTTSWGSSGFANSHMPNLTNVHRLPFIFSVACVNGNFVNNTCFAEAWLRSTLSDAPTGAIATLMSTINQSWNPPMDGQDEMVDILTEAYSNNIKRSFGGIAMNGCMHMNDQYGNGGANMTDTWTIFGDPSLVVRTDTPQVITATHNPVLPIGSSSFQVNASRNGAKAVLSLNGQILSTGLITNNTVNLTFTPQTLLDTFDLVIWDYNAIPYITEVPLIPANGPYVVYDGGTVDDPSGNNNSMADYGEDILLDITLENVGLFDANNVEVILRSQDPFVHINDSTENWGDISSNFTKLKTAAFACTLSDSVPDQHAISFEMIVTDSASNSWTSWFSISAQAPKLDAGDHSWDDSNAGDGDGKPEAGEVVTLNIQAINKGHSRAMNSKALIQSLLPQATILQAAVSTGHLDVGDTAIASFIIQLDTSINAGTIMELNLSLQAGAYYGYDSYLTRLGQVDEDFETGDLSKFNWATSGPVNWSVTSGEKYEGTYSAKSGTINNNQTTILQIQMNVTSTDSISFWKKVSCENGSQYGQKYDYMEFFIDNVSMGWWDGEVSWSREVYPVTAGSHTFKWVYHKDVYVSSGDDCAWIDYIIFPSQGGSVNAQPYVLIAEEDHDWVPQSGNLNEYPEPGEEFSLDLDVVNFSQADAQNVKVTLSSSDPDVIVTDSTEVVGNLLAGQGSSLVNGFGVEIAASTAIDKRVFLSLKMECDTNRVFMYSLPIDVYGFSVGIDAPNTKAVLRVWPNPVSGKDLNIELPLESPQTGTVRFIGLDGRNMSYAIPDVYLPAAGQSARISLPQMAKGAYLLEVSAGEELFTRMVIVK